MRRPISLILVVSLVAVATTAVAAQATNSTEDRLSVMATEQLEPGVFRVGNDGVRDLEPGDIEHLAVGLDGSVWTFGVDGFYRLGHEQAEALAAGPELVPHQTFAVGPDGTLWVDGLHWEPRGWDGLGAFDGERWSWHRPDDIPPGYWPWDLHLGPDGSVLALLAGRGEWQSKAALVARLEDGQWEVSEGEPGLLPELFGGESSSAWMVGDSPSPTLSRFDGAAWQPMDTPSGFPGQWELVVGPADGLWVRLWEGSVADFGTPPMSLAHWDGSTWQRWDREHFPIEAGESLLGAFQPVDAAPDGSLWGRVAWPSWESPFSREWTEPECDGVARFDGTTLSRYLEGLCVGALDVAPDGSAWLLAGPDHDQWELYVITPE
jgi:hypothetical protein